MGAGSRQSFLPCLISSKVCAKCMGWCLLCIKPIKTFVFWSGVDVEVEVEVEEGQCTIRTCVYCSCERRRLIAGTPFLH